MSNLYDGLDWYTISNRTFSRSVPIRIAKNVIIPVQFVDGDSLLITGGTSGIAKVLDARTAETIQTLDHNCGYYPILLLLTLSPVHPSQPMTRFRPLYVAPPLHTTHSTVSQGFHSSVKRNIRYIATGTSSGRSVIHVWVSKPEPTTTPPVEPGTEPPAPAPQTVAEGPVEDLNSVLSGCADAYFSGF